MLENAWNTYRAWAARSRELKTRTDRAARLAVALTILAAVLGALATYAAGTEPLGRIFAIASAVAAALVPFVGREILAIGNEGKWIRARATAEMLKSECYRFAAGAGAYADPEAAPEAFHEQVTAVQEAALAAEVTTGEAPASAYTGPPIPMTEDWYRTNRLDEQEAFFTRRQGENEAAVRRARRISFCFALLAAVMGGLAGFFSEALFAPAIAASTTVAAALAAYGLIDRRQFLAASYAAAALQIRSLKLLAEARGFDLHQLVQEGEDLLSAENRTWANRLAEKPFVPPALSKPAAEPEPTG